MSLAHVTPKVQSKSARLPAFIQGLASVKLHRRMREA
jgi:hypothetical protein